MLKRVRVALGVVALLVTACGKILGLGDPKAYPPDSGAAIDTNGRIPVTTEDAAACGNANLVTDPNNCGRCGHSCLGGSCERAACVPIGVTPADNEVFAVSGGRVFSITESQIIRTDSDGSHFLIADATQAGTPRALYATDVHALWSGDDTGVRLCSINGCGTDAPLQLSAAGKRTGPIGEIDGVDPLYPYIWANYTDFTVEKYATTPVVLETDTHIETATCPPSFAETDGGAYLIDQPAGKITLFHADPPPVDTGIAPDECVFTIAGANVFYTDEANIWRVPINADGTLAARHLVVTNVAAPRVIAVDDTNVYWAATAAETAIVHCPIIGCTTPDVLVDELPAIKALAIDASYVYFAVFLDEAFQTQIYKVAK